MQNSSGPSWPAMLTLFSTYLTCSRERWAGSCSPQTTSVAELESGLISECTKSALAAAKARGGGQAGQSKRRTGTQGKQVGNKQAVAAVRANAMRRASNLQDIVEEPTRSGHLQRSSYRR